MTRVLGLLLMPLLVFGCTVIHTPISHKAMKEPLVVIAEYDKYFRGLQVTSTMLGKNIDQETRLEGIKYSNAAYVYYIKAHTSLAVGNIEEFKVYMDAALRELKLIENNLKEIMEEFVDVHPSKGTL